MSTRHCFPQIFLSLIIAVVLGVPTGSAQAQQDDITVSIPDVDPNVGETVTLSIEADLGSNEAQTYNNMSFVFDPDVVNIGSDTGPQQEISAGTEVRDGDDLSFGGSGFTANIDEGDPLHTLRVTNTADNPPVTGPGEFLKIDVTLKVDEKSPFNLLPSDTGPGFLTSVFEAPDGTKLEVTTINQGSVNNSAPTVNESLPDASLKTPGPPLQLRALGTTVFGDPDGDDLSFSATSDNSSALEVVAEGSAGVSLDPVGTGSASITVSASDGIDETSTSSFTVTVNDRASGSEEPMAQSAALMNTDGQGQTIPFGDTDVELNFSGVSGSALVESRRFDSPPDGTDGIAESNVSQYRLVIESGNGLNFDNNTEVRFPTSDFRGIGVPGAVVVYSRPTPGEGTFNLLPTSVDGDVIVGETGSFSEFVLASDDEGNPLPVDLASFSARLDGDDALLRWQTVSETNNAGFEVQHQAPQEPAFREVGFVEGAGTTEQPQSYEFQIDNLSPGTHLFRLRQVDFDGTATLSDTASVDIRAERSLSLRLTGPNPVRQSTQLTFSVRQNGQATVSLYNVLGQRVKELRAEDARAGQEYSVSLSASSLASGAYFVRLSAPSGTRTQQVILVR